MLCSAPMQQVQAKRQLAVQRVSHSKAAPALLLMGVLPLGLARPFSWASS